jgi:hypothetical protein
MLCKSGKSGLVFDQRANVGPLSRSFASSIQVSSSIFLAAISVSVVACGPQSSPNNGKSSVDSVEIPQTPVENQDRIGFCWAYATVGLIESDFKLRTGKELQLSEEALGFYRMVEGIYYLTQNLTGQDLADNIAQDTFQGWVLKSTEIPDSFDLVKTYGVVPESVWKYKFNDENGVEKMVASIRKSLSRLVFDTPNPRTISRAKIISDVILTSGAWTSEPPKSFEVDGTRYTPKTYLESLEFNPLSYASVTADKPEDVEKVIRATKRALVRGVSVPLGFPVNVDRLKADTFSGKGVDLNKGENFFRDGGHAVLIDDFVNLGGKQGALPVAELLQEFLRPTQDLDYLVFKNSWGTDAKTNESGVVVRGSKTGFYKIDRDYLVGSANLSKDPELAGFLEVVVPVDIAKNPFGDEKPNPAVALP